MSKYRKIVHRVSTKDVKEKHLEIFNAQELEEENEIILEPKRSDWRNEIKISEDYYPKKDYIKSSSVGTVKETSFDKLKKVSRSYNYNRSRILDELVSVKPKRKPNVKVVQEKRSNWREEIVIKEFSDWTPMPVTSRPTMSTSQTFAHISGTVATFNALGGPDGHPDTVTVDWGYGEIEQVSPPTISEIPIQGHATPIDPWKMARKNNKKSAKQINAQLDASQQVAQMSNADVLMRARLEEFLDNQDEIAKENNKIREANRAKAAAYVSSKGFSWNKLEKEGSLVNDKGYGIVITNGIPGGKIMTGRIEIGYARPYTRKDTTQDGEFLGTKNANGGWYYPVIPKMEARDGQLFKGMPVGKPVVFDLEKGVKELPIMPPELAKLHARDQMIQAQLADFGLIDLWDNYLKFEDVLAKKMGVTGAKAIFDYYMSLSTKNDWSKDHDLTGLLSDRAQNALRDFFKNNPQMANDFWGEYNVGRGEPFTKMIDNDGDLSNVIGNLDQKAGDYIKDKGSYIEISKAYDFDNLADLMGGKIGGVGALAYAIRKNLILQHMIEFNKFGIPFIKKSPTMKVIIRINKNTGEIITSNNITKDDENWLNTQQTLVNLTKGLTNIGLPNDFGQWSINYAKGNMEPINKFSRGMKKEVEKLVLQKFKENPNSKSVTISYDDYGGRFNAMSTRLGLGTFKATRLPNGKVQIDDTFNVDKTFKTVGAFDIIPGLQATADRIVDIAHKRRSGTGDIKHGTYDEGGIPVKVILDMGSQFRGIDYSIDEPIVPKKKKKISTLVP